MVKFNKKVLTLLPNYGKIVLSNEGEIEMKNLRWIPKKYRERVKGLEIEGGLIDDCKYMLYFNEDWCWGEDYWALPVKSQREALEYIRDARLRTDEEKRLHK